MNSTFIIDINETIQSIQQGAFDKFFETLDYGYFNEKWGREGMNSNFFHCRTIFVQEVQLCLTRKIPMC